MISFQNQNTLLTKDLLQSNWVLGKQMLSPEPGMNVQANVEEVLNQIVSEPSESEGVPYIKQPAIPWATTSVCPVV